MKTYDIDWSKVNTVEDVKSILIAMDLHIMEAPTRPNPKLDPIRHLLKEVKK